MSWPLVKLKDCCRVVGGATPKRNIPEYWASKDIPWVTPKDISKLSNKVLEDAPEYISQLGFDKCATYLLPKGSVLLTSRAPIGNVAIAGRDMCTNQGFKSLVPTERVDSTYLYYCMLSHSPKLEALGNGATFKEVSKKIVEEFEIPLPPLEEQKRIAAILDKADAIRQKRKQAIELADAFLRSVFLEMFGDPVTNPKGWEVKPLRDVVEIVTGNTPSRKEPENYGDEIEWIKSDNINTPSHFLTSAEESLSESGLLKGRAVNSGAVLMTCIAGSLSCIGNIAIADRRVSFNQQINALVPKDSITTEYLYALMLVSKQKIQDSSTNSMKGMVSKGTLGGVEFPIAPERKQKDFVGFFNKYLKMLAQSDYFLDQSNIQFNSLSQKAFSGQL